MVIRPSTLLLSVNNTKSSPFYYEIVVRMLILLVSFLTYSLIYRFIYFHSYQLFVTFTLLLHSNFKCEIYMKKNFLGKLAEIKMFLKFVNFNKNSIILNRFLFSQLFRIYVFFPRCWCINWGLLRTHLSVLSNGRTR